MSINTDLANEAYDQLTGSEKVSGVRFDERYDEKSQFRITDIEVLTETAAQKLGKPIGRYITLKADNPFYEYCGCFTERCSAIAAELAKVCAEKSSALFLGLGNRKITPDSLGPICADKIFATRHIKRLAAEKETGELSELSVLSAGVMAQTGFETLEITQALCLKIKPAQVIVCDALACSDPFHMGRTVQLCSTGISPGSGVENSRDELSQKTLGVPTAAIGIPTVSRIFSDDKRLKDIIVTPKPIDKLVSTAAVMLSQAVNIYFHPTFTAEEIQTLIN